MKEANLLVFRDQKVKIGDFGISMKLPINASNKSFMIKGATKGYCTDDVFNSFQNESKIGGD